MTPTWMLIPAMTLGCTLLAQERPSEDSDSGILDVLAVAGTANRLHRRATKKLVRIDPPRCP